MPILNHIQIKSPGGRLLLAGMYFLLVLGSAWMIYPLLLLLSGSMKSDVDINSFDIYPEYFTSDTALFRKFEEQHYSGKLENFSAAARESVYSFEHIEKPPHVAPALLQDWKEFSSDMKSWPEYFIQMGHNYSRRTISEQALRFQHIIARDPERSATKVTSIKLPAEEWPLRIYKGLQGPLAQPYQEFRQSSDSRYFRPVPISGVFTIQTLRLLYGAGTEGVAHLNKKWGTHYSQLYQVVLDAHPPAQSGQRADWWAFVRETLSSRFIRFNPLLLPDFHRFLRDRYQNVTALNEAWKTRYVSWNDIPFPGSDRLKVGSAFKNDRSVVAMYDDLDAFVYSRKSPEGLFLDAPEFRWRGFLKAKYRDNLAAMNEAFQSDYTSFHEVPMPLLQADWATMQEHRWAIMKDFITRNYRIVWDYLSGRGRAIQNTIIFCALSILASLIINPLAAYALSRFQPRWGYKVLFFLMATMAFPHEVTQIPSFLMLRDLGMLNTFAALIIPSAANGYSIFLLKGFFDSLPKELYESATLDGASELRIFSTITMPLSAPILAVIALSAFTRAYGSFIFALLVCQKESMWTLMVYIYQLQMHMSTPVVFASLVIAAIPTLFVFVFCQNIIMRGIVVPVEK